VVRDVSCLCFHFPPTPAVGVGSCSPDDSGELGWNSSPSVIGCCSVWRVGSLFLAVVRSSPGALWMQTRCCNSCCSSAARFPPRARSPVRRLFRWTVRRYASHMTSTAPFGYCVIPSPPTNFLVGAGGSSASIPPSDAPAEKRKRNAEGGLMCEVTHGNRRAERRLALARE
jgi:hypothetical protein